MYTYNTCLEVVAQRPEFKKLYACLEDEENYYFLINIALDSPFYQVNKKNLSVEIIPGLELKKRKKKLKRVK